MACRNRPVRDARGPHERSSIFQMSRATHRSPRPPSSVVFSRDAGSPIIRSRTCRQRRGASHGVAPPWRQSERDPARAPCSARHRRRAGVVRRVEVATGRPRDGVLGAAARSRHLRASGRTSRVATWPLPPPSDAAEASPASRVPVRTHGGCADGKARWPCLAVGRVGSSTPPSPRGHCLVLPLPNDTSGTSPWGLWRCRKWAAHSRLHRV